MKTMNPLQRMILMIILATATSTAVLPQTVTAEEPAPLSISLEEYSYPYPELGRTTARLIPDAQLVEIAKTGHIPHLEMKIPFHEVLLNFLKE